MDECDRANEYADLYRTQAIEKQLAQSKNMNTNKKQRTTCIDCGEDIPPARQKAVPGCERCTACQTAFERKNS